MQISVKSNIDEIVADLKDLGTRRIEIAQQRALLGTARAVKEAEEREMRRVFDNPTRFTLGAFRVRLGQDEWRNFRDAKGHWRGKWGTVGGSELTAELLVKDSHRARADNFLQAQIEGASSRRQKAFEKALQAVGVLPAGWVAVPGERAKLDAYGNHAVGEIRQILSWFDAAERVSGSTQNMRDAGREKRRKWTKKKVGWEYFAVRPGDRRSFRRANGDTRRGTSHEMQPGIYRRTSQTQRDVEPVLIFVKAAAYKPRFDFYGVGRQTAEREFRPRLEAALRQALTKGQA